MDNIGSRIKQLIETENISVAALAERIGVTPVALSRNVSGENNPNYNTVMSIIDQFPDISLDWLMRGEGPMYRGNKTILTPAAVTNTGDLFAQNPVNPPLASEIPKERKDFGVKTEEKPVKSSKNQALAGEFSISENIDKIVIFFKNKTYITLRPEE